MKLTPDPSVPKATPHGHLKSPVNRVAAAVAPASGVKVIVGVAEPVGVGVGVPVERGCPRVGVIVGEPGVKVGVKVAVPGI